MTNLKYHISLVLILMVSIVKASDANWYEKEHDELNKIHNQYMYLFRTVWHHLDNNTLDSIEVFQFHTKQSIVLRFDKSKRDKESQFEVIIRYISDSLDKQVSSLMLFSKPARRSVSVAACDIKTQNDPRIKKLAQDQLKYFLRGGKFSHKRGRLTFSDRQRLAGVDYKGFIAENISQLRNTHANHSLLQIVKHNIVSYYEGRHKTNHWLNHMSDRVNYCDSYYVYSKGRLYGLNLMFNNKILE